MLRLIQVLQPGQLVTIVIALKLGPGLPVVGVLGFEYTAFDQASSVSSGAVCGSSTPCHHFGLGSVQSLECLEFLGFKSNRCGIKTRCANPTPQ